MKKKNVGALAEKLEGFAQGLPAQEENVLEWLTERARNLTDEDLGAASGSVSDTLGFEEEADSLEVKWSLSF